MDASVYVELLNFNRKAHNSWIPYKDLEFEVSTCRYRDLLRETLRYGIKNPPTPSFVLTVVGVQVVENKSLACNIVHLYHKTKVLIGGKELA